MIGRVLCRLGFHAFGGPAYRVSDVAMRASCARCQRRFAVNMALRIIVPWDAETEAFYAARAARLRMWEGTDVRSHGGRDADAE